MNSITLKEKEGFIPLSSILHNAPWNITPPSYKQQRGSFHEINYNDVRYRALNSQTDQSLGQFTKFYLSKYNRSHYKDLVNELTEVLVKYQNDGDRFYKDLESINTFKNDNLPPLLDMSFKYTYDDVLDFAFIHEWFRSDSVQLNCSMSSIQHIGNTYGTLINRFKDSTHIISAKSVRVGGNTYVVQSGNMFLLNRENLNIPYTNLNMPNKNMDHILSIYVNKNVVKLVKLLLILGKQIPEEFFRVYVNPFAPSSFSQHFNKNKESFIGNLPVYPCSDLIYRYEEPDTSSIFAIEKGYQDLANHVKTTISQSLIPDNVPF